MESGRQTRTSGPSRDRRPAAQADRQGVRETGPRTDPAAAVGRARRSPRPLAAGDILQLQRAIGNREVARMLAPAGQRSAAWPAGVRETDARLQAGAGPVAADAPPIQRLAGLPQNAHVQVDDGGPTWYGQIVQVLDGRYRVRVGGAERTVEVPEAQVGWHPFALAARAGSLAEQIIAAGAAAPGAGAIDGLVGEWSARTKPAHDPFLTLHAMKTGHALSVDPQVQSLLQTPAGVEVVKEVFGALQRKTGRQFIQFWAQAPAAVVEERGQAWAIFRDGIAALTGSPAKLDLYFYNTLAHDKGYAQIFEAAQQYLEISLDTGEAEEESFDQVLARAFNEPKNMNMWTGSQANSGKISAQLARGFELASKTATLGEQEDLMWGQLITAILQAHSPLQMDYGYAVAISNHRDLLFARVSELLPGGQQLHMERLAKALALFGIEEEDENAN